MDASIRHFHSTCVSCSFIAPSQPREPLILTPSPEWPFQQVVMDLFHVDQYTYLACADRLTGWLILYHFSPTASSETLIKICRELFQAYGVFEELSTDGGPQFTSDAFKLFLKTWNVKHRLSSVAYPQSNGRPELAVKTAKRLIMSNCGPRGSLNTDNVVHAILQYRNTPIQGIGLSPAQMLLHRNLKDDIPSQKTLYKPHPKWVEAAEQREQLLYIRNNKITDQYNQHSKTLPPLHIGDSVTIQNPVNRRWDTSGKVVEILPDRQYRIQVNGSRRITLRNRRFLRKGKPINENFPIPSADIPGEPLIVCNPCEPTEEFTPNGDHDYTNINVSQNTNTEKITNVAKVSRAFSRLLDHNSSGTKELNQPIRNLPTRRGRRGEGGEI